MFSALKRWTKMGSEESKLSMPSGVKAMGQALQRKFARGVQYNMKIIIKGDRNTGKTCMFHRLQGKPFNEQYIPTNEIQAGSIHWTYKAADDIVKVDVWDVVDVGKSKRPSDSLKIENTPSTENETDDSVVADANFLDVYKGTHGVIMVMDITKPWTFQYIRRELPKVPAHIPVLVLGSHRDMEEHRLIDQEEVTNFIQNLERPDRSPPVHYAESSMKDGFGLKYIHTFLSFPFLLLQREALLQQLQVNAMDMESTLEELQLYKQTEAQDYGKYIDYLEEKHLEHERKLKAEAEARAAAENAVQGSSENVSSSSASPPQTSKAARSKDSQPGGLRRWFSSSKPNIPNNEVIPKQQSASNAAMAPSNIEEFKPEDELDTGFLEEDSSAKEKAKVKKQPKKKSAEVEEVESGSSDESDSDSGPVNPMVASFTEDISDDETVTNGNVPSEDSSTKPDIKPHPAFTDVHITSSEEEEEEEEKEKIEVLKPEVLKPTPVAVSKNKTKESNLKLKVMEDSTSKTSIRRPENKHDTNDIDDWLDSPDLEPKISLGTPKEIEYTVTKVDVNNPSEPPPSAPSITMDEWSIFMSEQMKTKEKKSNKPSLDEDEEPANESKHHKKKEHKSGEKSRSKKHKKHKEKDEENEREKEPRRSKHKDSDKEKRKSEDSEKKKKSRHKHSKKKSVDSSGGHQEGMVTYEEL